MPPQIQKRTVSLDAMTTNGGLAPLVCTTASGSAPESSRPCHRLSPERTRRATWFERLTVGRLSWDAITRLNRWLELLGRIATVVWAGLIASIVLGVDVKDLVQEAINSGQPLQDVVIVAVIVPTLAFFVLHSVIGFRAGGFSATCGGAMSRGSRGPGAQAGPLISRGGGPPPPLRRRCITSVVVPVTSSAVS